MAFTPDWDQLSEIVNSSPVLDEAVGSIIGRMVEDPTKSANGMSIGHALDSILGLASPGTGVALGDPVKPELGAEQRQQLQDLLPKGMRADDSNLFKRLEDLIAGPPPETALGGNLSSIISGRPGDPFVPGRFGAEPFGSTPNLPQGWELAGGSGGYGLQIDGRWTGPLWDTNPTSGQIQEALNAFLSTPPPGSGDPGLLGKGLDEWRDWWDDNYGGEIDPVDPPSLPPPGNPPPPPAPPLSQDAPPEGYVLNPLYDPDAFIRPSPPKFIPDFSLHDLWGQGPGGFDGEKTWLDIEDPLEREAARWDAFGDRYGVTFQDNQDSSSRHQIIERLQWQEWAKQNGISDSDIPYFYFQRNGHMPIWRISDYDVSQDPRYTGGAEGGQLPPLFSGSAPWSNQDRTPQSDVTPNDPLDDVVADDTGSPPPPPGGTGPGAPVKPVGPPASGVQSYQQRGAAAAAANAAGAQRPLNVGSQPRQPTPPQQIPTARPGYGSSIGRGGAVQVGPQRRSRGLF